MPPKNKNKTNIYTRRLTPSPAQADYETAQVLTFPIIAFTSLISNEFSTLYRRLVHLQSNNFNAQMKISHIRLFMKPFN